MANIRANSMIKLLSLILLLNTFTLILSESDELYYDPSTKKAEKDYPKVQSLTNYHILKFKNQQDKPNYMKVTLSPKEDQSTPYLCYSTTNDKCEKDRTVYATRADKSPVFACVKRQEISNNINVAVTCKSENCGYHLLFEGVNYCPIDAEKGTVYQYVVSNYNNEMEFEIMGTSKLETLMYIGIEGSNKATIKVDGTQLDFKNVTYDGAKLTSYQINKDENETTSLGTFSIEGADSGELIRLTVYTMYDSKAPDNLLYPGGPAVMGYISDNENFVPELCLPVSAFGKEFRDISKFYLTGKIYSQYALFWPSDEYGEYIEDLEIEVNDGLLSFLIEPKGKKSNMCFEYSYVEQVKKVPVLFSVQIVPMAAKGTNNFYYIHPPMIVGQAYRHMLQKGKTLAYSAARLDKEQIRYSLNVFRRKGISKIFAVDCYDYPNCTYSMEEGDEKWTEKAELISSIGKISLYDRALEKNQDALDKNKKVFVISCLDDGNDGLGYCEFDMEFYYNTQTITLINGEHMAKYVPKGQQGEFKIFFNGAIKLDSVGVEIMIHNGEILFTGNVYDEGKLGELPVVTKYILSNKVFFYYQLYREEIENLFIRYKAIKDSFFTIKYLYKKAGSSIQLNEETIFPGESYLVEMDPNAESKSISVINDKNKDGDSFLTNFFSLNCEFKVKAKREQGEEEIAIADGYGQDILSGDIGQLYKSDFYNYTISIEKAEQSNYNNKMCMMYVAGTKIEDPIIIGNNVNQQIIFTDNFKVFKFLYPVPNTKIDLVVYANIIDKAYYKISIAVDSETHTFHESRITKSTPFYIDNDQFAMNCKPNTFCNIVIIVELMATIPDLPKTNPMVEITVREPTQKGDFHDLRVPTYIQKGIAKKDFTTGDGYYYLYTDIGVSDEGDVTVNFYRDYGEVYGRIVKKDTPDTSEEIEWMEMYRLPGDEWDVDSKNYNKYIKKFHIDIDDTIDCVNGCYLILGIIISQIGEYAEDWKFYPFSIITEISQSTFGEDAELQIITIQVDEFIIGNVNIAKNVRISQLYQVWLPRDTLQVQFDWQSELAGLYINVDDETLPTAGNADFILRPNGTDSILILEKQKIFKRLVELGKKDLSDYNIEDTRLIIGVWTDKTDSSNTELYSLRVHEVFLDPYENAQFDIIEVNTDQKVLCKPNLVEDNRYQCLFMVIYDRQDVEYEQDLLVYARSTNRADTTEMYGNFIDASMYDRYDIEHLKGSIPTFEGADYNSVKEDISYFYVKLNSIPSHNNSYFYISVISRFPDDIMMVSSINTYDTAKEGDKEIYIFNPSPRTEQIAQINNTDTLKIKFMIESSLIINIENLGGEADLRWEEDDTVVHNLRGRGDRLTLTTPSSKYKTLVFTKLKSDAKQKDQLPGFVFVIDYIERNPSKNFDEVIYGNSIEIAYRDTDLPLFLYSKAVDYSNDISLSLTFRDSHIDTSGEYTESPIVVKAYLDKRDSIYISKQLPGFEPGETNKMEGFYDPAIKTAMVFLPDYIIEYVMRVEPEDYPTLLLYVGKSAAYKDKKYETFNAEAQFTRINSLVIPVEKVYNYGKFEGKKTHYYKLKINKNKKIMKIVLSFNSWELSWAIGDVQSAHSNTTKCNLGTKIRNGKLTVTVTNINKDLEFIYLNIWKTIQDDDENFQLQNYAFKYINVEKEEEFYDFEIIDDDPSLEYTEKKNGDKTTIECKFNRIKAAKNEVNVTYFLKIADAKNCLEKEVFQTVALSETPYYAKYERNPQSQSDKITLSATGDFSNWGVIQVIAQIQKGKALEYVAYQPKIMKRETPTDAPTDSSDKESDKPKEGSNTGLFIGISIGLVVVIVGLIAVVIYFQKRNQSLVKQVKHVSFQNNSSSADPDLLLVKK